MLITQNLCVSDSLTQKIVNVPLPSQQAAKILQELQTSCNSPNKTVQVEALKCWGAWIQNQGPHEWDNEATCRFAVKPLLTKKLRALHRDVDICKLKLSLFWELLSQVQGKMELKGSQHILKIFLQSCFAWLSSIDTLENKIIVLILKLLLNLFKKFENPIICDSYTFSPIQLDESMVRKFFHIFNDNILDVFDYRKKVKDNSLVIKFWICFLEYCEICHENITTSVWHRIFKVNQNFCLDHSENIKDRLIFLHACATNVKTVLLSSKYIGGESCFTTPCEALIKKLVEVCSTEVDELSDFKMFSMCKDVSEVLAFESVAIRDYEMCIYLLDCLEDFAYKSFFWGVWCGLVECFKKKLLNVDRQMFTGNQSKFYRKLRGVSVNFELDKRDLTKDSAVMVQNSIDILKIGCFCGLKIVGSNMTKSTDTDTNENFSLELTEFGNKNRQCLEVQLISKVLPFEGTFGKCYMFPRGIIQNKLTHSKINFNTIKTFCEFINGDQVEILLKTFFHFPFPFFNQIRSEFLPIENCYAVESKSNLKMLKYSKCDVPSLQCSEFNVANKILNEEKKEIISCRTRGRKKYEVKDVEEKELIGRKRRKSFEVLVQEIVTKNKLRKSEKNTKGKRHGILGKKELRSGKQIKVAKEEMAPKRDLRKRKKKGEKKSPKGTENGKLDNFFKVIDSKSKSKKILSKAKNNKKKAEKSETSWKQTSLKVLMTPINVEKNKKSIKEKKKIQKKLKSTPEKKTDDVDISVMKRSPFKEVLHDHEYAKSVNHQSTHSLEKTHKTQTKAKKFGKKRKSADIETEEAEITSFEKENIQVREKKMGKISNQKKLKMKTDDDSKREELDSDKVKKETFEEKETEIVVTEEKIIENANKNFKTENVGPLTAPPGNELIIGESYLEKGQEQKSCNVSSSKELIVPNKFEDNSAGNICFEGKVELEEESLSKNVETKDYLINNIKKRIMTIFSPRPKKKLKLSEDNSNNSENSEGTAKKENFEAVLVEERKEMLSPIEESLVESSAVKEDVSPSQKSPSFNRTTSSRALKMMALISEPSSPVANQANLEVSSKMGPRHHLKKFSGVDKSSRVSKMLARLSESMKQEGEDLADGKLFREISPPPASTPTSHKFVAENISPKPFKKKKFIGFDDSKNETIVYETDTPPSQILEQRILLRDG